MAFFRVMAMNGGGGGDISNDVVIKGTGVPTAQIGENGQIYLSCTSKDLSDISTTNESSMSIAKYPNSVNFSYIGGVNIGAQAYMQLDLTDIRTISVTVYGHGSSYDNYSTLKFSPIFIIENTVNPANNYVSSTVTQSATGETYNIATVGDKRTFVADVSQLTGNYYLVFSSSGATSDFTDLIIDNKAVFVGNTYAKVNDAWQDLIGTEIKDIALKYKGAMGGTDAPVSSLGGDGDIYYQYAEYTQSIKSLDFTTGGVFLPICGSKISRYVMKFTMTGGSSYACPLGSRISNSSGNFLLFTKYSNSYNAKYGMNGSDTTFGDLTSYFDANKNLVLDISASNITLSDGTNDVTVTPSQVNDFCTPTMCVGAMASNNRSIDTLTYCAMNFYSLDVYENDELCNRFIPAQDNGTDGLLEVFTNKFYAKTGTVSSTALATPIHNKVVSKIYVKIDGIWELLKGVDADDVKNARTPKQDRTLANFDFTDSLTDIVDGRTATLSGATRDSNGITIDSATEYVSFDPALLRIDTTYEIKFGTVNLTPATNTHSKLITWKYGGDTPTEAGFTFHYQTQKWGVWDAETLWQDSDISDINYFNNATLKIYIDIDGNWHFYKDDVLFFETTTPLPITRLQTFRFGSDNKSCWTCTIQSFKVISPWGTEFDKTETSLVKITRVANDSTSGSYTFDENKLMTLWTDIGVSGQFGIDSYHFKVNGVDLDLTNYFISRADISSGVGYDYYENIPFNAGDVLSWSVDYANRYFIMFG